MEINVYGCFVLETDSNNINIWNNQAHCIIDSGGTGED